MHGRYGNYKQLGDMISLEELPQFFLVYLPDPSDSGKIHNNVKTRWLNGDADIIAAMENFAEYHLRQINIETVFTRLLK